MTQLTDSFPHGTPLREARTDRNNGLVQGVAVLGRTSQNGRVYPRRVMKEAASLYSGAKLYLDHPTDSELRARKGVRSVFDLAGRILNPRVEDDVIRADLEVLKAEPAQSLVFALAEQMPSMVGLSHSAEGEVRVDENGVQIVEQIHEVRSVDLVTEPATVSGLYESVCHGLACEKKKEVVAGLRQRGVPDEVIETYASVIETYASRFVGGELEIPETKVFGEAKTVTAEEALDDLAERMKTEIRESRRRRRRDRRSSSGGGVASKQAERNWDDPLSRRRNGHPPPSDEDVADAANRLFT